MLRIILLIILFNIYSSICAQPLYKKMEMRGVWFTTVHNMDWPSRSDLSSDMQKQEMLAYLDKIKAANLNVVIFQIRPSADAFYKIDRKEPYSQWLVRDSTLDYDPLEFAIQECHKRGLWLHAWINPYRISADTTKNQSYQKNPLWKLHPDWVIRYGKSLMFNPANKDVQNFIVSIVSSIVKNYEIDGIHFDDYFYPYPNAQQDVFDDSLNFLKNPRGFVNKKAWRRDNVNQFIKKVHDAIRAIKPWVAFGISPFGVWRNLSQDPTGSATKAISAYDDLSADVLYWDKMHWIDYVVPQLYWYIGHPKANYSVLDSWWNSHIVNANLYIGKATYLIDKNSKVDAWKDYTELIRQDSIDKTLPNIDGMLYFHTKSFVNQLNFIDYLLSTKYKYPALPPTPLTIKSIIPKEPPRAMGVERGDTLFFNWEKTYNSYFYIIYKCPRIELFDIDNPSYILDITGNTNYAYTIKDSTDKKCFYFISSVSHTGQESINPVLVTIIRQNNNLSDSLRYTKYFSPHLQ